MSTLTVAQLKEELRRNGVSFDDGKLKKYYVDLYENMKSSPSVADYSDDEWKVSPSAFLA